MPHTAEWSFDGCAPPLAWNREDADNQRLLPLFGNLYKSCQCGGHSMLFGGDA